jgi:hypothetical protein
VVDVEYRLEEIENRLSIAARMFTTHVRVMFTRHVRVMFATYVHLMFTTRVHQVWLVIG